MSSGDRAKPAASYKDRNPFDISRRSETEVAAEIAQRMAAWKQARGRSYATPAAMPESKQQQGDAKQQPRDAKQPHIAAPVQPARLPKFGEPVARAPQPSGTASERIPLFAIRRAMPPAPSPKQPSPAASAPARPEPRVDMLKIDSLQIAAPLLESLIVEHPGTEAARAAAEALRTQRPQPDPAVDAEAPADAAPAPEAAASAPEVEAPAVRQEIETRDIDAPGIDAPIAEMHEPEPSAPMAAEAGDDQRTDAADADALAAEMSVAEPAPAATAPSADTLAARRDEAVAPAAAPVEEPAREAHDVEPRAVEMPRLDPMAMEMRAAELAMSAEPAETASEREDPRLGVPRIDAPEIDVPEIDVPEIDAPKAPSLDQPAMEKRVAEIAVPADLSAKAAAAGSQIRVRADTLPRMETRIEGRRVDTLRADPWIAGRRPVFPHIEPEAWDAPPPAAASRANRQRSGTGWAIGLGSLLLIAGITAPAAIWQQQRQHPGDQDRVATATPLPATPPQAPTTSPAPSQATAQPAPAPQQAASQPQTPQEQAAQQQQTPQPPAPAAVATASAPAAATPPAPAETLSEVGSGGELKQAPIVPPPTPKIAAAAPASAPASKTKIRPAIPADIPADEIANPMVPHPFVPEASPQPVPFRPDSTSGAVVGAAAGAAAAAGSVGMPVESATATVALKPSLNGQLKPVASASKPAPAARQSVVRKPRSQYPQTLDQMFQTLIDTLSEGQPVNPATKPLPPGNRR